MGVTRSILLAASHNALAVFQTWKLRFVMHEMFRFGETNDLLVPKGHSSGRFRSGN
jgi:hypothetical protein